MPVLPNGKTFCSMSSKLALAENKFFPSSISEYAREYSRSSLLEGKKISSSRSVLAGEVEENRSALLPPEDEIDDSSSSSLVYDCLDESSEPVVDKGVLVYPSETSLSPQGVECIL